MATQLAMTEDQKAEIERFKTEIVEPSMSALVILDFWAEWCGPCKQLGPVLDKVAADYADKGVILRKIDVDANKFIAAQFQIRSIPTVYAMFQGQPVADLSQARTEGQIKTMLDEILRQLPIGGEAQAREAEIAPLIEMGESVLGDGDAERALSIFSQLADMAPGEPAVVSGLARAMIALGRIDEARAALDALPEEAAKDAAIARARAALDLAEASDGEESVEDLAPLRARVEADPNDLDGRFALAGALLAQKQRDEAADQLLGIVAADRDWNEGAAREKLLKLFEATGLEDPWVAATRRRLSAILFG